MNQPTPIDRERMWWSSYSNGGILTTQQFMGELAK